MVQKEDAKGARKTESDAAEPHPMPDAVRLFDEPTAGESRQTGWWTVDDFAVQIVRLASGKCQ